MKTELKKFIDYHKNIINLATRLNKLFQVIIFVEYIVLSALLCVNAFQVVMSDDFATIFTATFHGMASFIDLFIYSYGGQQIMDSALHICDDCYKTSKELAFIVLRTHKEIRIKSLMYHASMPTFTVIMSRTMSLITLLQSFT